MNFPSDIDGDLANLSALGRFLNPVEDHPLELAVDAFVWNNRPSGFVLHSADSDASAFFAKVSQSYADMKNDSTLAFTADSVRWQYVIADIWIFAQYLLLSRTYIEFSLSDLALTHVVPIVSLLFPLKQFELFHHHENH